jgi:hypothetical protein
MEEAGQKEGIALKDDKTGKEEIFSKVVRAGKRTYFFDVKATKKDDYYLTITESKKRLGKEGKVFYEKHKIFLYKEDFEKFAEGLKNAVDFIEVGVKTHQIFHEAEEMEMELADDKSEMIVEEFTNVEFDDLGKK